MSALLNLSSGLTLIAVTLAVTAVVASPPREDCLSDWLRLAGGSESQIDQLHASGSMVYAELDEASISSYPQTLLALALGYNAPWPSLVTSLKPCVDDVSNCAGLLNSSSQQRPCTDRGRCVFAVALRSTVCQCPDGLRGDKCEIDVDECSSKKTNLCAGGGLATCDNAHGSFFCTCRPGYYGDGFTCEDINECAEGSHACHGNATCSNTVGSFSCECQAGTVGNGFKCEVDICFGDQGSRLCHAVADLQGDVRRLQDQLKARSRYIARQDHQAKVLTRLFNQYEIRVREVEKRIDSKCNGILQWRTYTKTSKAYNVELPWDIMFTKRRSDTAVRVWYTVSLGLKTVTHKECYTISVLFDGAECVDPAPVRGGVTGRVGHNNYLAIPGIISGVCNGLASGPRRVSTSWRRECYNGDQNKYEGYYGGNQVVTASMHIDEMCPNAEAP